MVNFESGILDKARLLTNFLLLLLLSGNIYLGIQYFYNNQSQATQIEDKTTVRIQTSRFLKFFIDVVLNTKGTISYDDRVKLESDVRQLQDPDITKQWDAFVASKDSKIAQDNAVKLMSMLANKML